MFFLDLIKDELVNFVSYLDLIGCNRFLNLYNDTILYICIFITLFLISFLGLKIIKRDRKVFHSFNFHFFVIGIASTFNTIISMFFNVLFNNEYYWKEMIDNYFLILLLILFTTLILVIVNTIKSHKVLFIIIGLSFIWFSITHILNGTFIYLSLSFYFTVARKWENPNKIKKILRISLIPLSIINAILIIVLVPLYKVVFIF